MTPRGNVLAEDILTNARVEGRQMSSAVYEVLGRGINPGEKASLTMDDFFATRLKVRSKEGKLVPFIMNAAQWDLFTNLAPKNLVVKPRQIGTTTLFQGLIYEPVARPTHSFSAVSIADEADNTAHMVEIFNRFHDHIPERERPQRQGRYPRGIKFPESDSTIYLGTAGNRKWGRSKTVHFFHGSEVAYWPDGKGICDGVLESMPFGSVDIPLMAVLETTANGAGGYYYEKVQASLKGLNDWKTHFYTWYWAKEYRLPLAATESIKYITEEEELIQKVQDDSGIILSPEQIKWRRSKQVELGAEFRQEYPESIETCFLTSGRPRFDIEALANRINTQCHDPVYQDSPTVKGGNITYGIRIYKRAEKLRDYVIGADTAEGITVTSEGETDFCAAVIRDRRRNEHVATIHGKYEPLEFAYLLSQLGIYYNNALIGVERNNHGHAVLGHLANGTGDRYVAPYQNLYIHEDDRLGWLTSSKTRPVMLDDLAIEYATPGAYAIRDGEIISEGMTFVIKANGRAEAQDGSWDDLTIADAIAGQMRSRPQVQKEVIHEPVTIGDF